MISESKNLFSIFRLNRFFYIGDIKSKFYANRFLIFRFLVAGFYCITHYDPLGPGYFGFEEGGS